MKTALYAFNMGELADVRLLADIARQTEAAGYDGFFIADVLMPPWDQMEGLPRQTVDVQIALAAIALATERVAFGPVVTPLPRRRPVKVAREAMSLDQLSRGRLVLGVGAGSVLQEEFVNLGEDADARVRADRLDESLQVIDGLLRGEPTTVEGTYVRVRDSQFHDRPAQSPRVPIWCAAVVGKQRSLRRAAQWDGIVILRGDRVPVSAQDTADVIEYVRAHRSSGSPFDVVLCLMHDDRPTPERLRELEAAGVTWVLQSVMTRAEVAELTERPLTRDAA